MTPERRDVGASGAAYEPYVGRWSWLVAREFVGWLETPREQCWLDIGCGTGALAVLFRGVGPTPQSP
jgi:methylase of polypeptide subunit release factors